MEAHIEQARLHATFHVNAATRSDALAGAAELGHRLQELCLTLQGQYSIDIALELQPPVAQRRDRT